jgi:hypothetical protein
MGMINFKFLKISLLTGTSLVGALFLTQAAVAKPVGNLNCIDSANGTQCTNGTSNTSLVYPTQNPTYVAGDFVLGLDNYNVTAVDGLNGVVTVQLNTSTGTFNLTNGSTVSNSGGNGVNFNNQFGDVNVNTAAGTSVEGHGPWVFGQYGSGIFATSIDNQAQHTSMGNVNVIANGDVFGDFVGIGASNVAGTINVEANGNVTAFGLGSIPSFGLGAIAAGSLSGDISIKTGAYSVVLGQGSLMDGIFAISSNTVSVPNGPMLSDGNVIVIADGSVSGGRNGINAISDLGDVSVQVNGTVKGTAARGISAETIGGDILVTTSANSVVKGLGTSGIYANTTNNTDDSFGTVSVYANGTVFGNTYGIYTETNLGDTVINAFGNVTGQLNDAIYADVFDGNNTSDTQVNIHTKGVVIGGDRGIVAFSDLGTINVQADNIILANSDAIHVVTDGGDITVSTAATSSLVSDISNGVYAHSKGSGTVNLTALGNVHADERGLEGISDTGAVNIITGTGIISGSLTDGLRADAGLTAHITNNGVAVGGLDGISSFSLVENLIDNHGLVANTSNFEGDVAIDTSGAKTTLNNLSDGLIVGQVWTSSKNFDDVFNNQGEWATKGESNFGGGNNVINNSGTLVFGTQPFAAETTLLSSVTTFNNSGLVTAVDAPRTQPFPGPSPSNPAGALAVASLKANFGTFDHLTIDGNFVGSGASTLALDADVSGNGSLADYLTIKGNSSGSTAIEVEDAYLGAGALNTTGILLVDVAGTSAATDFHLANGPINKGLFVYDLVYNTNKFLLISTLQSKWKETVVAVDGVQSIWQGGADAWGNHEDDIRDAVNGVQVTAVADPPITESRKQYSMWARLRGNWLQRDAKTNFAATNYVAGYRQSTTGIDAGMDFGGDVGDGNKLLFGIVGGYASSNIGFNTTANSVAMTSGSLGVYASFVSRGFFADVLVKNDWTSMDYFVFGTGHGLSNAQTLGASADVGYRFSNGHSFIEPLLSLNATSTHVDDFVIGGGNVSPGMNSSARLGVGARVGVSDVEYSAALTVRVWNGVGSGNTVQVSSLGVTDSGLFGGFSADVNANVNFNISDKAQLFTSGTLSVTNGSMAESIDGGLRFLF